MIDSWRCEYHYRRLADVSDKFGFLGRLCLSAYEADEDAKKIRIYAIGGHENFCRDLKRVSEIVVRSGESKGIWGQVLFFDLLSTPTRFTIRLIVE